MPDFDGLPRAVLTAISKLSGPYGSEISGKQLVEELREQGQDFDVYKGRDLMAVLKRDGYIDYYAGNGTVEDLMSMRLDTRGRQEVERWPSDASMSAADFQALLAAIADRAEDESLPEEERSKLRAALGTLGDLSGNVGASVLTAWIERQTGLSP